MKSEHFFYFLFNICFFRLDSLKFISLLNLLVPKLKKKGWLDCLYLEL